MTASPVCGWVGTILDVDLSTGQSTTRSSLPCAREALGGRALAARIAWEELAARCDPFEPSNRIILATGPLTGTLAPTSGRTVMASISPRTYPFPWYTHSTLGGWFGPQLKYAGYDVLVLSGSSRRPVILDIQDSAVRVHDGSDLWGQDARATQLTLKARFGSRAQILCIGPAGEKGVRFASVQHAEENAAGHSGFGAVWGAKGLKAVVVRGSGAVRVADPTALVREVLNAGTNRAAPVSMAVLPARDLQATRPICSQACTFHCGVSSYALAPDGRRIPGQCLGSAVWADDGDMPLTRYEGGGVRVPPAPNFAGEGGLRESCNALGLDLWFRLVWHPWLVRARELGIDAIRGYPIAPHDGSWFAAFMHDLAQRRGLGEVFADGLRRAMDTLEGELPAELIALGRELEFAFGFPAHREGRFWDEEPLPFWVISAMMYASDTRDPTIGTHQSSLLIADLVLSDPVRARRRLRSVSQQVWGDAEALEPTWDHKAPVAIWSQNQHMLLDSLPLCDFAFPQVVRPIAGWAEWEAAEDILGDLDVDRRLLEAVTGIAYTRHKLDLVAERAFTLERLLLARAGRARPLEETLAPHFRLPCRADGTCVDAASFSRLLDEYYAMRGWDLVLGWPTAETLGRLGLGALAPEVEALRRRAG